MNLHRQLDAFDPQRLFPHVFHPDHVVPRLQKIPVKAMGVGWTSQESDQDFSEPGRGDGKRLTSWLYLCYTVTEGEEWAMSQQETKFTVSVAADATGATVEVRPSDEDKVLHAEQYSAREWALVRFAVEGDENKARERLATFTLQTFLAQTRRRGQARRDALERRLQEAVAEEDYELAARLRDQLRELADEVEKGR